MSKHQSSFATFPSVLSFEPHKVGQMGILISHFASEGVMLRRRHLDERFLGHVPNDILQCSPVRYISGLLFPPFMKGMPLCVSELPSET